MWTVNLKFLPEEVFQSRGVALGLLCAHLLLLLLLAHFRRGCDGPSHCAWGNWLHCLTHGVLPCLIHGVLPCLTPRYLHECRRYRQEILTAMRVQNACGNPLWLCTLQVV